MNGIEQNYVPCGVPGPPGARQPAVAEAGALPLGLPAKAKECGANACCKVPLSGGDYDYIG